MKLQINTNGAWRDVIEFQDDRKAEVMKAVDNLAGILGNSASWSVLHDGGRRELVKSRYCMHERRH